MERAIVKRLAFDEAQTKLSSVIDRARHKKEYFVIEKNGVPSAGLMDIDEFEDYLELQDPKVKQHIRKSYQEYRAGKGRPARAFVADLQPKKRKTKAGRRQQA